MALRAVKRVIGEVLVAAFFSVAASSVPEWRSDPRCRPVAVLPIGEPTPLLAERRGGRLKLDLH